MQDFVVDYLNNIIYYIIPQAVKTVPGSDHSSLRFFGFFFDTSYKWHDTFAGWAKLYNCLAKLILYGWIGCHARSLYPHLKVAASPESVLSHHVLIRNFPKKKGKFCLSVVSAFGNQLNSRSFLLSKHVASTIDTNSIHYTTTHSIP